MPSYQHVQLLAWQPSQDANLLNCHCKCTKAAAARALRWVCHFALLDATILSLRSYCTQSRLDMAGSCSAFFLSVCPRMEAPQPLRLSCFQCLMITHAKKHCFCLVSSPNSALLPLVLRHHSLEKRCAAFHTPSHQVVVDSNEPSLPQGEQTQFSQSLLVHCVLQLLDIRYPEGVLGLEKLFFY